jgi:hypothetical protein
VQVGAEAMLTFCNAYAGGEELEGTAGVVGWPLAAEQQAGIPAPGGVAAVLQALLLAVADSERGDRRRGSGPCPERTLRSNWAATGSCAASATTRLPPPPAVNLKSRSPPPRLAETRRRKVAPDGLPIRARCEACVGRAAPSSCPRETLGLPRRPWSGRAEWPSLSSPSRALL